MSKFTTREDMLETRVQEQQYELTKLREQLKAANNRFGAMKLLNEELTTEREKWVALGKQSVQFPLCACKADEDGEIISCCSYHAEYRDKACEVLRAENKTLRTAFAANEEDNAEYLERIAELEVEREDAWQANDKLRDQLASVREFWNSTNRDWFGYDDHDRMTAVLKEYEQMSHDTFISQCNSCFSDGPDRINGKCHECNIKELESKVAHKDKVIEVLAEDCCRYDELPEDKIEWAEAKAKETE